jgi:hypothetical protein
MALSSNVIGSSAASAEPSPLTNRPEAAELELNVCDPRNRGRGRAGMVKARSAWPSILGDIGIAAPNLNLRPSTRIKKS